MAKIIERLATQGMLDRADAWEYLANSREAWKSEDEETDPNAAIADDHEAGGSEEGDLVDEEEAIDEEPLSQLVERLDTIVFGLIETLDAEQSDLPRLLDEALNGCLWARQIEREGEDSEITQRRILEAHANLIWSSTAPQARKGHFAMGVGFKAGLAIDAMAEELSELVDRADAAALPGDVDDLTDALVGLAEQLLFIRPFIPDKKNPLPEN